MSEIERDSRDKPMAPLKMQRDEDDVAVSYLQTGEQFKCRDPTEVQENTFRMIDDSLNFLKNCVLGPSGPKIEVKAVQETVGSRLRGTGCA